MSSIQRSAKRLRTLVSDLEPRARSPRRGAIGAVSLLLLLALAACGSSSPSPTAASAAVKQACQQIEAVLSDGPDPSADPVGYAQAQILPLRQIRTSDGKLREAIEALASSYRAYASSGGASAATKGAAETAIRAINRACPQAGATL
jgi:uncharacterized heparinase superfamily protein